MGVGFKKREPTKPYRSMIIQRYWKYFKSVTGWDIFKDLEGMMMKWPWNFL
jgi:hypothetical protein